MIPFIENHIWQSTFFAIVAWVLTLALRRNRARVRHAVWMAASVKFLIPFSALVSLGAHLEWRKAPPVTPTPLSAAVEQIGAPFSTAPLAQSIPAAVARRADPWPAIALSVWACGLAGLAASWVIRWRRIRTAIRGGSEVETQVPIRAIVVPEPVEPGVFGIFRPVLMLPEGIFDRLSPSQWKAVAEHELSHVRHRDNLFAAMQMVVETLFWFHPLVWWIGKKMIAERERACDEAVLGSGSEPRVYAEAILNVCKLYVASPLVCVAGVTGAELKDRIQAIVSGHVASDLGAVKKMALMAAAAAAIVGPIVIGIMTAPPIRAQSAAMQKPVPKWEVAAIKPCESNASAGRKGVGGGPKPGRLNVNCSTVMRLVENAYGFYANGRGPNWGHVVFEGAPAWLNSERYSIEAKGESPQGSAMMQGPMMQKLLEERFKLKIRREIRELPVYHLTLAKGGPKNLKPSTEGSCIPLDLDHLPVPEPGKPDPEFCGMFGRKRLSEGEMGFRDPGVTMTMFAEGISAMLDRNVIDKTGLSGTFDIDVQVSVPDPPPQVHQKDESDLVFTVVQKIGMKLESTKGPVEVFVIEHIERPSDNFEPPPAVKKP